MSPPCSFSTSPISAPSTCTSSRSAECLAGNWMSSRFTEARDSTVTAGFPGVRYAAVETNPAIDRRRFAGRAGAANRHAVRGPAPPSCSPARESSPRPLYQRGVGFELLVTVRALIAMPLFAWLALRRAPADAPAERVRPARLLGRRGRRHRVLLRRRAGGFLGADAHRRLHRARAAVQLPGHGGAVGLVVRPARAGSPGGLGHGAHLRRHLLRHGRHRFRRASANLFGACSCSRGAHHRDLFPDR